MLGLGKVKTTAEDLGARLAEWTEAAEDLDRQALDALPKEVDSGIARRELRYLRVFAIDLATYQAFGDTPTQKAVLSSFYGMIMLKAELGTGLSMSELDARLKRYGEALSEKHHMGPGFTIGKAFSELCGSGTDIQVIMAGSIGFGSTMKALGDLLKKIRLS